jgi:hypothetical protein
VTCRVDVTGGSATVGASIESTSVNELPINSRSVLDLALLGPGVGGRSFTADVPFTVPIGANIGGGIRVRVTGTDERGGAINVFRDIPVTEPITRLPAGICSDAPDILCTFDDRFKVKLDWRVGLDAAGHGLVTANQRYDDGGWFYLPTDAGLRDPDGFDVFVQMADGCAQNDHWWVFVGSQTDVEFELTVTDTLRNTTRTYSSPPGEVSEPITDTSAFATCP